MFGKWKINKVYGATLAATYEPKNIQVNEKELPDMTRVLASTTGQLSRVSVFSNLYKAVILRTRRASKPNETQ